MKKPSSLDAKKIALTKRILMLNDPKKLDAVSDALDSDGYMSFSAKEIAQLKAIRDGMADGSLPGVQWEKFRKGLWAGKL